MLYGIVIIVVIIYLIYRLFLWIGRGLLGILPQESQITITRVLHFVLALIVLIYLIGLMRDI